uniref:Retroviral polymerase SH3-like domain-containing protein n=1 Tax=Tanacetum cinerariifolium TaxID=118510 RepID=A0A6L2NM17_TANCI|nr:hypothetical protein [Tanacetum cinerariifolium]
MEVIEFGDSYQAPLEESGTCSTSESSAKKKGRTVLRFSKYETAQELRGAILKTFGGNEATKKTKKNQLKQQYGNFKAEGSETLEQTFNRLQAIVSHLEFMNVEIEEDDLNQNFLTSLALEWLMYTIVWRNRDDLDTMTNTNSGKGDINTASIPTASTQVSTASADVAATKENHALVADDEALTEFALMAKSSSSSKNEVFDDSFCSKSCRKNTDSLNTKITKLNEALSDSKTNLYHYKLGLSQVEDRVVEFKTQEVKFCEKIKGLEFDVESKNNKIKYLMNELEKVKKEKEGLDSKLTGFLSALKDLDTLLESQRIDKNKEGLPEFADDTITDYSRPSPSIESNTSDLQNSNSFVSKHGESSKSIMSKPMIKFVKAGDSPKIIKTNKVETARKPPGNSQNNIDDKGYWDSGCSWHMTGNISYLSDYEPYDRGYVVLFTDSECIVLGKDFKLKYDTNVLLRTPRQHNMYFIDLNNIVPHKDLTCLVAKASADERKFDAKGDEGYFIGYSVSSKAFRVFNKRTKKVEENPHVDFLENKLIEKGAGPNWLFDIDTLTNTMNYVPVVITGPSSTNILAHMESSNNDAQDACNADAPESSGIFNPTATSKSPPAEQMESLTVESMIHTVSSPVPTACLDNSPETSSPSRLISKEEEPKKISDALKDLRVKPISTKWVLKNKKDERGIVIRNKARGTIDQTLFIRNLRGDFLLVQVKDGIFLSQDKYVGDILKKFGYSNVRSANTPMDKKNPWGKDPTVKRIFRYQKGHPKLGLWYSKESPFNLVAYSDSNYGGATQDRKSTTKGCQFLGIRLISWQCKKQIIVATSTTEAEYVAAASGCGQVLWI